MNPLLLHSLAARVVAKTVPALLAVLLIASSRGDAAAATNAPATASGATNNTVQSPAPAAPQKLDEAAFKIIAERNIFNAERIGPVRVSSSRRPTRVESFKLVGTMAYAKGAFAFFEGSSPDLTKVLKADGIIAGHKLVDILADGVKLETDGKILEIPVGSAMRREDEGTWHLGEAVASSASASYAANRDNGDSDRSGRSSRGDRSYDPRSRGGGSDSERTNGSESSRSAPASPVSTADQSEILKRLMERRERESK